MLSCPLCCQSQFSSVDLLRTTLINAINRPVICPICNELQHGLDNLAAHLSTHIERPNESNYIEQTTVNDVNNVIQNITTTITTSSNISNELNRFSEINNCEIQSFPFVSTQQTISEDVTSKVISSSSSSPVLDQKSNHQPVNETGHENNNNNIQLFFCHLCACTFRSQELQQMHMQLVHELNVNQVIETKVTEPHNFKPSLPSSLPSSSSIDRVDTNLLQCNLCSKRFKMIGSLRLHVRMVHGVSSHMPSQKIRSPRKYETVNNSSNLASSSSSSGNSCTNDIRTGESIMETSLVGAVDESHANQPLNNQTFDNYGVDTVSFGTDDSRDADNNGSNSNKDIIQTDDRAAHVHECDICRKHFTTKYFLKKHKRIHTGKTENTENKFR